MKNTSLIDKLVGRIALDYSNTYSRRSFLKDMGRFAITSSVLYVGLNALANKAQAGPPPAGCNAAQDCGVNGLDCTHFGVSTPGVCDCSKCLKTDGCPKGTTLQPPGWVACCPCDQTAHPGKGSRVAYVDCCGTPDATDCKGCTAGAAQNGTLSCYEHPNTTSSVWCNTNSPACTQIKPKNECCVPTNGAQNC